MLAKPQAEIVATFDDGSPAIVHRTFDKGRVTHFAFLPGLSCIRSQGQEGRLNVGYSAILRDWICGPARESGIAPPVKADMPLVETPILLSEHGAAVTILNWTGEPIANLTLHVRVPFEVKTAQAVRAGTLKFEKKGDEVIVSLAAHGADIVLFRP